MTRFQKRANLMEEAFNPFKPVDNSEVLKSNLNEIDSRSIRSTFKATQDPIQYVFDSFDNTSLKTLAKDFVKEGFDDMVSFITRIINN
ncbi:MAG: hypothetical protein IKU37_04625 [Candidatus Gastranaerophilales bacterium]|nr:hypothetical protein [Candidatus Gastranaerophilales bacterium]